MPLFLLATAAVVVAYQEQNKKNKNEINLSFDGKTHVRLLPYERRMNNNVEFPYATISFFEGDPSAASDYLRDRMEMILKENPWLGGWLQFDDSGTGEIQLVYDDSDIERPPNMFRLFDHSAIALSRNTPYEWYGELMNSMDVKVKPNSQLVGKDEAIWKVSVIPDVESPDSRFALVMSLSNKAGDIHTFYQVYNMLSSTNPIVALNPNRHFDFGDAVEKLMGKREAHYIQKCIQDHPLWKTTPTEDDRIRGLVAIISDSWIKRQLAEVKSSEDLIDTNQISPADVITSWFWQILQPTVGLMANNFRDRLSMLTVTDAGNYQNPIPLAKDDYKSAVLIHNSRKGGKRCAVPLTNLPPFVGWNATFSVMTDWSPYPTSTFQLKNCQTRMESHMPLYDARDMAMMPSKTSAFVLFRVGEGECETLGALIMAPRSIMSKINATDMVEKTLSAF